MFLLRVLLLMTFVLPGIVIAQNKKTATPESSYQQGLERFKSRQYDPAAKLFAPLTREGSDQRYSASAHYYYALSMYHLKKYNESVSMLKQLQSRFPSWKKDEVNYLLGANNLSAGYALKGIEFLNKVVGKNFARDIQGLKQSFVSKITNLQDLKNLQKQYPQDRVVAECLVARIIESATAGDDDLALSASLIKRFDIKVQQQEDLSKKNKATKPDLAKDLKSQGITVSVLMPFRLQEFSNTSRSRSNQFAYDYYQGLQVAAAKLQSEGLKINLQAYDIGNEETPMKELIKNEAFMQTDLLIGPLYQKTIEMAKDFSEKNKVLMVNPLSTDGSLLDQSRYLFLTHPSLETQVSQILKVAKDISSASSALIFYGNTPKDSLMAAIYEKELQKNGGKVLDKIKFNSNSDTPSGKVPEIPAKPAHILLFSSDTKSGPSLMAALSEKHLSDIPVLATSISFDFPRIKPGHYGKKLYLVETEDLNLNKASVVDFQQRFWNFANTLPSIYAVQGYDHLTFFVRMLEKYGRNPITGVTLRRYEEDDFLLTGFDFTSSRDNQLNSILKYDGGWVKY